MLMKEKIENDMKMALKQGEKLTLSVLRMVLAEGKNERIRKRTELSEDDWIVLLHKQIKTRRQSIVEFEKGKRADLADQEKKEIEIIQRYLPKAMEEEDLTKIVKETIQDLQISSPKEMGKVIGVVMTKVKGKAEGGEVAKLVKQVLENS